MRFSKKDNEDGISIRLNGQGLEDVQCLKWLGSHVEKSGQVETKVKCSVKEG